MPITSTLRRLTPVPALAVMLLGASSCASDQCVDTSEDGEPLAIGAERIVTFRSSDRRLVDVRSGRGIWTSDDDALPTDGSVRVVATRVDDETIVADFGPAIGLVPFAEVTCQ